MSLFQEDYIFSWCTIKTEFVSFVISNVFRKYFVVDTMSCWLRVVTVDSVLLCLTWIVGVEVQMYLHIAMACIFSVKILYF